MKLRSAHFFIATMFATLVLPQLLGAAERTDVVTGRILVTSSQVTVEGLGSFPLDLKIAQCFDMRGERMGCETLAGIGYADKARVTFVANKLRRIDLIELQQ
jgi:hypothetical protein